MNMAMKIRTKINLTSLVGVITTALVIIGVVVIQKTSAREKLTEIVNNQGISEATKIVQTIYLNCKAAEQQNQKKLLNSLNYARNLINRTGKPNLSNEKVKWKAVNQFTKESIEVELPKFCLGTNWLGQNYKTDQPSLIVDEVKLATADYVTIFQRMNEQGDMLRVCTSVLQTNGLRAIGTYIPRKNPDGTDNPVVSAVLTGQTYKGRAFVVDEWHQTCYEPIWDPNRSNIIGMLYVGVSLKDLNKEFHDNIINLTVGKSGYVYVLGAKGDQKGRYIISYKGQRDGELILDAKDSDGKYFIQSIIQKALATKDGSVEIERYPWKNPGEDTARYKVAAITYFEPWDWVIGAGTYEDDYHGALAILSGVLSNIVYWALVIGVVITAVFAAISWKVTSGIVKPIVNLVEHLTISSDQIKSASNQLSESSQILADGASKQAASLEETSASLEELASMTRQNAGNAEKAKDLAVMARAAADRGMDGMSKMVKAMDGIKEASTNISKILKTIDEIAFQTNILALNAAVEAARAGEAGQGFAVVADEVRNLAQRSAQAARDTAEKIQDAIQRTEYGVEINSKVAADFNEIVEKFKIVEQLVSEISAASKEQNEGIEQINKAVAQIDKVTQSNAASSEENASAAHELTTQAEALRNAILDLKAVIDGIRVKTEDLSDSFDDNKSVIRSNGNKPRIISLKRQSAPTTISLNESTQIKTPKNGRRDF